ncbi:type IV pilus modification protein PilV [Variovorax paradoxus]|uniref:Type IV pilus modification protein PilV n=1 Tax=Variovorax paradoxus TaxID=34073 RepID=A0A6I6HJE2_VARPD|nr:type IV pilus modification protein PilV [Variovorax paradoxus]QGW82984.1 type IV pilus modification protein PilV [Variovorax paradoxus]
MATSRQAATGFSLVEVLVSIAVLSVGLLGSIGMLLTAVRTGKEAATFAAAVNLARDLSEKVRMNPGVAARNDAANTYLVANWTEDAGTGAAPGGCAAAGAACDPESLAAWDMGEWKRRVAKALPGARLSVCFDDHPWNASAGEYAWPCSGSGRNVVVKLGWVPHADAVDAKHDGKPQRELPPRLVMQLVVG